MTSMFNWIKKLDFHSSPVTFYVNGQTGQKSIFGGLISFILLIITSLLIYAFGHNFFYRLNPTSIVQDEVPVNYTIYNITNDNFPFAFRFTDYKENLIIEDQSFYFVIHYESYQRVNNSLEMVYYQILPYKLCDINDFEDKEYFISSGFEKMFCIDFKSLSSLKFGGNFDGNEMAYFYISYYQCPYGSVNPKNLSCLSNDIFEEMLMKGIYFSAYLVEAVLNPSDYTDTIRKNLKYFSTMISKDIYKDTFLQLQDITAKTDTGWILSDVNTKSILSFDSFWYDIAYGYYNGYDGNPIMGTVSLFTKKSIKIHILIYEKIQTLAANIGGILKIVTFILTLVVQTYDNLLLSYNLIKETIKYSISHTIKTEIESHPFISNIAPS